MPTPRGRYVLAIVGGALLFAIGAALWSRLHPTEQPSYVDFSSDPVDGASRERDVVRFAIAPVWSPERTFDNYYELLDYLAADIQRPLRLVRRKTYLEVNELLRNGSVQVAIVCTGAFVQARRSGIPLDVLAVPTYTDGAVYRSLFIARADRSVRSLRQLEGRAFAYSDPLSLSGYYYPLSRLVEAGHDPSSFFSRTVFTYSHDGSMRAVLDGIVDAAAVDSLVYDYEIARNPRLARELRVFHRSPPFGVNPVVAPRSTDRKLAGSIQRALVTMREEERGRSILGALGVLRFRKPPKGIYETATRVVDEVLRGRGGDT